MSPTRFTLKNITNLITILCLILSAVGPAVDWMEIPINNDSYLVEIDLDGPNSNNNLFYVWERVSPKDIASGRYLENGAAVGYNVIRQTLSFKAYDCRNSTYAVMSQVDYNSRGSAIWEWNAKSVNDVE